MSDTGGYGSHEHPFHEPPYTGKLKEVHWGGSIAVKWNFSQFLHAEGAIPVANSPTGTLSVWLRFDPDSLLKAGQAMSLFFSAWMDLSVSARDDWSTVVHGGAPWGTPIVRAYHKFKFYPNSADAFFNGPASTYAYLVDTGNAFEATSRWYHVFAQWDTGAGTLSLTVNGRALSTAVYPGSYVIPGHLGPPFDVPWGYLIADDTTPNTSQFLSNTNYNDLAVGLSIAELWLEVNNPTGGTLAITLDKFVDLTTGKPKPLGKDGELPIGKKPAFYFARSGSPQTFVVNRGYGGAFTFARGYVESGTLAFSYVDLIGPAIDKDPPLDEPDQPKFTPTAPPISLVA